jgi:hypothetical protein
MLECVVANAVVDAAAVDVIPVVEAAYVVWPMDAAEVAEVVELIILDVNAVIEEASVEAATEADAEVVAAVCPVETAYVRPTVVDSATVVVAAVEACVVVASIEVERAVRIVDPIVVSPTEAATVAAVVEATILVV